MLLFVLLPIFAVAVGKGVLAEPLKLHHVDNDVPQNPALQDQEKVKFQFYYETGCPWSIEIYTSQLEHTVKELAPYLDITTYPYGNGVMKLNGTELKIICQHRELECYGNMLHACAIDALIDVTKYVTFNSCTMKYDFGVTSDEAVDECGKVLNVDPNPIKECAKKVRGFQLLLENGIETSKIKKRGVPWWYVNGVSKISGEKKPLKEILCDAFTNPPEVCKK